MISKIKTFLRNESILVFLTTLVVAFMLLNPVFISSGNIVNLLVQSSIIIMIAFGMTFVILTGGIDLSVGAVAALVGVVFALVLTSSNPMWLALLIALGVATTCGVLNGLIVSFGRIQAFVATLAMMSLARGVALLLSNGRSISVFGENLPLSSDTSIIVTLLIVFVLCLLFLKYTKWGKYMYAIGSNRRAAWLSGVNVRKYEVLAYTICGFLTGIAAIILVSRLNAAQPTAGILYELDAIAAVVIGGASLFGGRGSVSGTLWAALVLGVLANGLSILNITPYIQQIAVGILLVLAVVVDNINRSSYSKRTVQEHISHH
jgi:ribose/xylose/arabinose/galactoside ABC-type transport system permease subunit